MLDVELIRLKKSVLLRVLVLLLSSFLHLACAPSATLQKDKLVETTIVDVPNDSSSKASVPLVSVKSIKEKSKNSTKNNVLVVNKTIAVLPASTIYIDGDSTLRKYSTHATKLGARINVYPFPETPKDLLKEKWFDSVLIIPVSGIKSGNETLDEHLSEALEAKQYPDIRGVVKSYEIKALGTGDSYPVILFVELSVAGTSKVVPIDATIYIEGKNVRIQGSKDLLMTDFNIKPPTLLLGTIKVANAITIRFNFLLGLI